MGHATMGGYDGRQLNRQYLHAATVTAMNLRFFAFGMLLFCSLQAYCLPALAQTGRQGF